MEPYYSIMKVLRKSSNRQKSLLLPYIEKPQASPMAALASIPKEIRFAYYIDDFMTKQNIKKVGYGTSGLSYCLGLYHDQFSSKQKWQPIMRNSKRENYFLKKILMNRMAERKSNFTDEYIEEIRQDLIEINNELPENQKVENDVIDHATEFWRLPPLDIVRHAQIILETDLIEKLEQFGDK